MSEPTITITVPQDAELSQAIDEIIGLPNDEASTGEKVQQAVGKIEELQQTLYQVPIQGSSKRPNGKKNKKKSKLPDETLRLNPPQPTLPVKFLVSDPGIKVESLPTYEEMTIDELFNGPSLMETQPDLEGEKDDYPYSQREIAKMTERQRKYEEGEPDLEQLQKEIGNETKEVYLYLSDKNKSVPYHFLLFNQGQASASTCPVYVGSFQSKQIVAEALCNDIHTKLLNQWGTLSCHCGLVPKLQLSQTPRNKNKVFLECPKPREAKCRFFQ